MITLSPSDDRVLASLRSESSEENLPEISRISKVTRQKYIKTSAFTISDGNHEEKISKNFWIYCKNTFERDGVIKPDFDKASCLSYLKKPLQQNCVATRLTYGFQNLMKELSEPPFLIKYF